MLKQILLLAVTFLAFSNSFDAGISLDSDTVVLKDPRIREATAANLGLIVHHSYYWPNGEAGLYRPLTTLSYLFNYAILGEGNDVAGYHWVNFLLHAANVLLVYALALRLVRRPWPSLFIAGLWGVHPVLTEAVTNIAGRADLLAAFGVLGGFLMYLKSAEAKGWLIGVAAAAAVGVYSKESALCLPGVIAAYELVLGRNLLAALAGCGATLPAIAAMLYQRWAVLAASAPAELPFVDNPILSAGFFTGRLTALKVCARYLGLMIWPGSLSSDYSYNQIPLARGSAADWIAWLAVAAFLAIIVWLYRRDRAAFFFACLAVITFLPVSNLLFPIGSIMGERFLYLPSLGVLACIVIAVYAWMPRWAPAVLCLAGAALAVRTYARNTDWQNESSIVTAGVQASPNSFKLHERLAELLFQSGAASGNVDPALAEAEKSLAILDPVPDRLNVPDAYRNAGGYYLVKGDLLRPGPGSAQAYQRALQILLRATAVERSVGGGGDSSVPFQMLSAAYLRLGEGAKAVEAAGEALALHPQTAEAYRQIAATLASQGQPDAAAVALIEGMVLTSTPDLQKELAELNPARQVYCEASEKIVKARLSAGRPDLAGEQKRSFAREYGCPDGSH